MRQNCIMGSPSCESFYKQCLGSRIYKVLFWELSYILMSWMFLLMLFRFLVNITYYSIFTFFIIDKKYFCFKVWRKDQTILFLTVKLLLILLILLNSSSEMQFFMLNIEIIIFLHFRYKNYAFPEKRDKEKRGKIL